MKTICLALLCLLTPASTQDPVVAKKDNLYIEFITDCDWLVLDLKGKIKLKADKPTGSTIGFRAWEPNRHLGTQEYRGMIIYRDLGYPWARDYLAFAHSAFISTFPDRFIFPSIPGWHYAIHAGKISAGSFPNAGAIMRLWGPSGLITLYNGEALITHGDRTDYVKVDENDYLNFPPWQITLK
jgi:hypothetical protein